MLSTLGQVSEWAGIVKRKWEPRKYLFMKGGGNDEYERI
jgi:hypothetical protein